MSVRASRWTPTNAIPEVPPNFARNYIEGGWRMVERIYGCRHDVILKWFEQCGGLETLQVQRRQYLRDRMQAAREKGDSAASFGVALAAVSRRSSEV